MKPPKCTLSRGLTQQPSGCSLLHAHKQPLQIRIPETTVEQVPGNYLDPKHVDLVVRIWSGVPEPHAKLSLQTCADAHARTKAVDSSGSLPPASLKPLATPGQRHHRCLQRLPAVHAGGDGLSPIALIQASNHTLGSESGRADEI